MHDLALFIEVGQEAAADALMSQVFGTTQTGSLRVQLSPTGEEPATHLGGYARGLTAAQKSIIEAQQIIQWEESSWQAALTTQGLTPI